MDQNQKNKAVAELPGYKAVIRFLPERGIKDGTEK
jgi:hypothetical protein